MSSKALPSSRRSVVRTVSLVLTILAAVALTAFFMRVIASLMLPLFLALVLAVLFRPMTVWLAGRLGDHPRISAALTTFLVVSVVLLPLGLGVGLAVNDLGGAVDTLKDLALRRGWTLSPDPDENPALARQLHRIQENSPVRIDPWAFEQWATDGIHRVASTLYSRTMSWVAALPRLVVATFILIVGIYYFLADGPHMLQTFRRLMPLDDRYETKLSDEFESVCRAVVLATLVSAAAQAAMAGVGFAIVRIQGIFLLTFLTMIFAMVPMLGAAVVWGGVAIDLLIVGRYGAAAFMVAWGLGVSFIDNIIKPYVIQGNSKLHPLVALVSLFGGLEVMGFLGVFVGPIVAAFLFALLEVLRFELDRWHDPRATRMVITPAEANQPADSCARIEAEVS